VVYITTCEGERNTTCSCKPSNTTSAFRRLCVAFETFQQHQGLALFLLDQQLPDSRHPGLKKLFRRREDSHGGSACAFQICLGVDRAQERGRLGSRRPRFIYASSDEGTSTHGIIDFRFRSCVGHPGILYVPGKDRTCSWPRFQRLFGRAQHLACALVFRK